MSITIAGRARGGRPLRRRREMVLMSLHRRLRGTAALQKPVAGAGHGRHCWPRRWRASAPSAPRNGADVDAPAAARDRSPPETGGGSRAWAPLLAEALEGVRSVGAAKWC